MRRITVPGQDRRQEGLPPLAGTRARVLILGSFPGVLSLERGEYYGNPRNGFWAVMQELFGLPADLPYPERSLRLKRMKIALWDVVYRCERPGSADSRIRNPEPNDIAGFVRAHPAIQLVALNGRVAGRLYHRIGEVAGLPSVTLPSTSPANARMPFAAKVLAWRQVADACRG